MTVGNNLKIKRESFLFDKDNTRKIGIIFFSISAVIHALVFFGVLFFQNFHPPKPLPPVIQVDLVSFMPDPAFEDSAKSKKEGIPLKEDKITKKAPVKNIKPDISLKSKPMNLKELMAKKEEKKKPIEKKIEEKPKEKPQKTEKIAEKQEEPEPIDSQKELEEAREKIAQQLEQENQDKIAQALERLKRNIQDQEKNRTNEQAGGYSAVGKQGFKPIDLYHLVIGSAIEQNWVFNDILAQLDRNLEVRILIKILKNGEIRDIIYETRSGNRYLDESAKKAISKANPLPALPPGMPSYDVVLGFTPQGLK
ncbi:MAG: cell envelope integrity protein TolA [Pseudomonadota bacterium]